MSNVGSRRLAGVDELMTAVAEQARADIVGEGMPRDWVCMSSHSDDEDGVPIVDPLIPPCLAMSCPESRFHHHVSACGHWLLDELAAAVERREDPMGSLLEIVSR
jgi:hypothetical protein